MALSFVSSGSHRVPNAYWVQKIFWSKRIMGSKIILGLREAFELKNVTKSGKSPQGGVSKKHQKVQNSKFGLFDKRGFPNFEFFPN